MVNVVIDLAKSVDENAGTYFELAKKAKKKVAGTLKALEESRRKLAQLQKDEHLFLEQEHQKLQKKERKKEWYEKFHWFISSEDFLCIGGKDSTTNEIIIKKHLEKDDIVFHTDMAGSPFFIVKNGHKATSITLQEAAQATAVYSKAWKAGHTIADVFYVNPDQVSKEAKSGEYMSKGSFMIRGKTTYLHPSVELAIGIVEEQIIGGPESAIKKQTATYVIIIPGEEAKGSLTKKIKHKLGGGELNDIMNFLPAGGGMMKKS
ncbi:MAG TPA: NFACT RNA binding domain-containing protein [Candidatus Nanoarchaeia archaeon]|nr:NFACT RNA binding domain-containing protein [Candidatus Nanoarchaeia archaeon]